MRHALKLISKPNNVFGKSLLVLSVGALAWACGPERRTLHHKAPASRASVYNEADFSKRYTVDARWLSGPGVGRQETNKVELSFAALDGTAMTVDACDFKLWMKVHGHGGLDWAQKVSRSGEASFIGEQFFFTMEGPWELQLSVDIAGTHYKFDLPVEVGKP